MKIRPLHDRQIVKRLEEERKTASDIVVPTPAEKPDQGEPKAMEDGKVRPLDIKVGDRILFGKYSGQTVKVKGDELLVTGDDEYAYRPKPPLTLYFDRREFSVGDIANMLAMLSDLYRTVGGDRLVIETSGIVELAVLEPVD